MNGEGSMTAHPDSGQQEGRAAGPRQGSLRSPSTDGLSLLLTPARKGEAMKTPEPRAKRLYAVEFRCTGRGAGIQDPPCEGGAQHMTANLAMEHFGRTGHDAEEVREEEARP
jgi:hypothetical protein